MIGRASLLEVPPDGILGAELLVAEVALVVRRTLRLVASVLRLLIVLALAVRHGEYISVAGKKCFCYIADTNRKTRR